MAKVTIQEVARNAGVSKGTISRVLNSREGVNPETRALVLGVMERLGYVPDPQARQLARRGRHVIGLALDSDERRGSTYYGILRDALEERFSNEGYSTRVLRENHIATDLDGVILLGVHLDDPRPNQLTQLKIPFAMVGRSLEQQSWVDIDNHGGLAAATKHLINLGHKNIAYLGGAHTGQASIQRLEGYRSEITKAGLEIRKNLFWDGDFSELGGYRAVRRALEAKLEFSAIAAASDEMAIGAISALEDAGLRVPWDVSVTGFDDLPIASKMKLTSVRQPIFEVGIRAAELLLERMGGKAATSDLISTTLQVRQSTAALLI
ncbi:MAG: LacI family DNA-binding transcriptional regulator [Deinococcales bacterium]